MAAFDVVNGNTIRDAGVEPLEIVLDEAGSRLLVHHLNIPPTTAVTVFDLNPIASTALGAARESK